MSDLTNNPVSRPDDDKPFSQRVAHQPVSARVPERVKTGVFSTGQLVLDSPREFCVDFMFALARPHQVVARVVIAPLTMQELVMALEQNLGLYQQNFGQAPSAPTAVNPPPQLRPSVQEIYEQFKLTDEVSGGVYANSVMISHNATEFCFDFIAGFYPTSVVTARVMISAASAPRFLGTLRGSLEQWRSRANNPPAPGEPPAPPTGGPLA